jgi:hypothetical protein
MNAEKQNIGTAFKSKKQQQQQQQQQKQQRSGKLC